MRIRTLAAVIALATLATGCAGMFRKKDGPANVEALLDRVVHVQAEALQGGEHARGAYDALSALTAPGFQGDAVAAYEQLIAAVEQSIDRAETLSASIPPMKAAANRLFVEWTTDLEAFGDATLREKSQARLEETRARYESVLSAAVEATTAFDAYNADLRDQVLFLENDLNASSLAVVSGELGGLEDRGAELGRRLEVCTRATRVYVEATGMPRQRSSEDELSQGAEGSSGSPGAQASGASAPGA